MLAFEVVVGSRLGVRRGAAAGVGMKEEEQEQ